MLILILSVHAIHMLTILTTAHFLIKNVEYNMLMKKI